MIDITPWLEKKYPFLGLVENPPDHSTQNGLLFTATACVLGLVPIKDVSWLCYLCLNLNRSINRYPKDTTELEGWDDLTGIAAIDPLIANSILSAVGFFGYINNTPKFSWSAFLGRYPGFIPFLKVAAGRKINLWSQCTLAFSFLGVVLDKPTDSSNKCLAYLRIRTVQGKYWIVDQAIKFWWKQIRKQNGSMSAVYSVYFTTPGHPIPARAKELGI